VRGRKNGAPPSSPSNGIAMPALRQDERELDAAYDGLFEALRLWRRDMSDPALAQALAAAYDRKEDQLRRVAIEDDRLEQAKEHPVVPG
jgi:hypothetical protein